ncbi:major facilitator superfamily domain-containing protein, partial [Catenaria anguillulae PL171]
MFGNWFAYDTIASLNLPLAEYLGFDNEFYQYLLSLYAVVYSLPNIILPFFGGVLIDRFGPRSIALGFCALTTVGQLVFVIGLVDRSPFWSIVGRTLFGLGGETLSVAQQRITTKWFRGSELALAIGVNLSVARLGSVINDFISPALAHRYSVPAALWFSFLSCAISFAATCILIYCDRKYAHICPERPSHHVVDARDIPLESVKPHLAHDPITNGPDGDDIDQLHLIPTNQNAIAEQSKGLRDLIAREVFILRQGFDSLGRLYWLIQLVMMLLLFTTVPFNTIHSAFLCAKYYPNQQEYAAQIMAVPDTISAVMVPFIGTFLDHRGHRAHGIIASSVTVFIVHFVLGAVPASILPTPIPALIVLGISYALLLTFMPVIPLLVPAHHLGCAYGMSTAVSNFSWTISPVIVAGLAASDPTYFKTEMYFAACGLLALFLSIYVNHLDARDNNGLLNKPSLGSSVDPANSKWTAVPSSDQLDDEPTQVISVQHNDMSKHPIALDQSRTRAPQVFASSSGDTLAAALPVRVGSTRPESRSPSPVRGRGGAIGSQGLLFNAPQPEFVEEALRPATLARVSLDSWGSWGSDGEDDL